MADSCVSCGKELPWVEFYRCEKCDGNVCKECLVNDGDLQLCQKCSGGGR